MDCKSIYVVEDNAIERGGFIAMLNDFGYKVCGSASNGETAIAQIQEMEDKPDIIIMDINLPHMDGLSTAREISKICDSPVVIVTGYKNDSAELPENVFGYIQKPVASHQLNACIKIAFDRCQESRAIRSELQTKTRELQERKLIEQAKGIIIRMNGCSEREAMSSLQKKARNTNRKLVDVARAIIESSKDLFI